MGEGEKEGLGGQAAEHALYVKEVSGAMADVGAVVSYVGEELATIWGAAQGLLVHIQNGDVATVAGQRVQHAGAHRGGHSEGNRKKRYVSLLFIKHHYSMHRS